jgi:Ca2+-binding RTX toxin-like protein
LQPGAGETKPTLTDVEIEFETIGSDSFTVYNGSNAPSAQTIQDIQFILNLGGDDNVNVALNGDLGLPGLGLSVASGTLAVSLTWSLALDFGIDRSNGLYIQTQGTGDDLSVVVSATLSPATVLTAQFGLLAATATPASGPDALPTQIELTFTAGITGGSQTIAVASLASGGLADVTANLSGSASIDLDLQLGFDIQNGAIDTNYPSFTAELVVGAASGDVPGAWTFSSDDLDQTAAPDVALNNIQLNFGGFLNNFLGGAAGPLASIAAALKPLEPVLDFLTTSEPILGESLLDAVVQIFGGDEENVGEFFQFVQGIVDFASDFGNAGGALTINFGSFDFNSFDLRQAPGSGGNAVPDTGTSDGYNALVGDLQGDGDLNLTPQSTLDSEADQNAGFSDFTSSVGDGSISFPILDNPMSLVGLLFGHQATLMQIQAPELSATANASIVVPVWDDPPIDALLTASISVDVRFAAGYDTYGLTEAAAALTAGDPGAVLGDLADGFYVDDTPTTDALGITEPNSFVRITGTVGIAPAVGIADLATAGVGGAISLSIAASLKDTAPPDFAPPGQTVAAYDKANNNDNKTRLSEFDAWVNEYNSPLCAFNLDGSIGFQLFAQEQVLQATFNQTLVSVTLFDWSTAANCFDAKEPLGTESPTGVVTLYTGPLYADRDVWTDGSGDIYTGAAPPSGYSLVKGPTAEGNDDFTISQPGPGDILVTAGDGSSEEFTNVTGIAATLGTGGNKLAIASTLTETDGKTAVNETIIGGTGAQSGNDTIMAGGGDDLIEAGGGLAEIHGGAGSDTIYGGTPTAAATGPGDTITGGSAGGNVVYGSDGSDVITVPGAANTVFGGASQGGAPSVIYAAGGGNLLVGGTHNDAIEAGGGNNTIIGGGGGTNLIYGGTDAAFDNATALLLFGTPPVTPAGRSVIFAGAPSLALLQEYGNETAAEALGLPVAGLPAKAAAGDGNDTVHAGPNGDQIFGGAANNLIFGGAGPDTIIGGPGSDTITGGGGNESIVGRGTDTINGGTGNDTIDGGPGDNTIYGGGGNDFIQGGNANNTITGGSGADTILSGGGNDIIVGGSGDDSIRGQGGDDTIQGGSGNDVIDGYAGHDTIYGGTGNDTIDGDAGTDTILGGTGTDVIYGDNGTANTIFGGQDNDLLSASGSSGDSVFGGNGDTTIYGGEGNDCIFGGTGPDQITGGSGADTITGGGGFDVILGGTGNDSIQGGTAGDLIYGGTGADTIAGGSGNETIYAGALPSQITGGSGADLLVGGATQDTITGGTYNDTIYAGAAPGNVLSGGSGNDLIYGTDSIRTPGHGDTITGGAGDTTIYGSAGDDSIFGGSGNDDIYAGLGNQTIVGGTGSDLIEGGPGDDLLEANLSGAGTAADTIYGGTGTSTIAGDAGDELLYGGAGRDLITGGAGDDVIYGGAGTGKTITGGGGGATIWGSAGGQDSISGGAGNVEIFGEGGDNTILGGSGNDTIEGELTGNLISGGAGNDLLVGGEGNDTINAGDPSQASPGTGQDTIYGDTGSVTPAVAGNDQITGNAGNDQIYPGAGSNTINPGTGPGTQVYSPGVAPVAAYAETPVPEQNPVLTAAAGAAATLPANVAASGVWTALAGGTGSSLATPTTNDGGPAIAAGATTRYVAWIDTSSGVPAVYVATESGSAWNQLAGSAQSGGISGLLRAASEPAIALLASGQPIIAWTAQNAGGSDIDAAEYSPAANGGAGGWVGLGGSLSSGGISQTGKASNAQILLVNGEPTVVWLDTSGGVSNVYAKQWNGTAWVALGTGAASGGGISGSSLVVTAFAAATDGTRVAVAWTQDFASAPSQVYLTQYSGGAWSALSGSASGTGLSAGLYAASAPTVAYANGTLFVAWQQTITNPAQPETIFQQAPVIYAAEYTGSAWQPAGTGAETGFGVSGTADIALAPKLASNGTQLILAWSDEFIDAANTDTHLYVLTWNGTSFAPALPGQASGEGIAQSGGGLDDLSLTLDPNGNPFAAWADPGDGIAAPRVIGTPVTPADVTVATAGASLQTLLSGPNAGLTLVGQPGLGATLDGVVTVTGGDVTLQGVTVAGDIDASGTGFALRDSVQTSGTLTLSGTGQLVMDNTLEAQGVSLQGATGFELRGDTIVSSGTAIAIGAGNSGTIDNNLIAFSDIGIDIANALAGAIVDNVIELTTIGINYLAAAALAGNQVEYNTTGVVASVDNAYGGFGFAPGSGVNVISDNTTDVQLTNQIRDQTVSDNQIGITGSGVIGGATLALANDISGNVTGVSGFTGTIQFSRIDGNATGIAATANLNVLHDLIYNNTTVGLEVSGVANVQTSDNTFYTATGDNIRIENGSSNVEIQNSILWAQNGYDIYVANNSQSGYFSDYNTLFAGPNGVLVYWTRNFTDILDWQDEVALYDLHSVGATVVNPDDGKPHFVDLPNNDFQLLPLAGGQQASDAALEQGNPIVEYDTQLQNGNLLTNPGFEQGLTGWATDPTALAGVAPDGPAAYDGNSYFVGGTATFLSGATTATGYAEQRVNLLQAGYSVAQLDSGTLSVTFGGYTRSLPEATPDTGSISISFLDASGTVVLGSMTVNSSNTTTQWALTSGTIALPAGTRSIVYQFNTEAYSGDTSFNAYLDDAFVSLSAGSGPRPAVPGIGANDLTNPGFESGLDGWTASPGGNAAAAGQVTGYPAAFSGSSYFAAGAVQQGTVTQTVNLLSSGLTASAIDGCGLNLVYGGRVISGDSFPPDQGQIAVTMFAANGTTVLGSSTVQAPNTTDRWALAGGTTALLAGTRYVQYTFTATEQTSEAYDQSFLDDAFVSTAPAGVATPDGAYNAPAVADATTGAGQIAPTSPVLYVNWVDNIPHTITWNNFGDAGASTQSVNIALYQETPVGPGLVSEPKLLEMIATAVTNTGSYTWIPTPATVPYGTYGLIVQVSLIGDPAVSSRSTEPFTVPQNGSTYYVNDGSTANDQYTTAPGSNRNDGMLPSQPLPDIDTVPRNYSLTAGSVIDVDPGTYDMIAPFEISGSLNYGLGIDQGFTVQGPTNGAVALLTAAIPGNPTMNLI